MYKIAEEASKLQLSTPSLGITTIVNTSVFAGGLTFNSLSRDHNLINNVALDYRAAFNSLSRDHLKTCKLSPLVGSTFNSLSRDHCVSHRQHSGWSVTGFQLPLSGSREQNLPPIRERRRDAGDGLFQLPLSGSLSRDHREPFR